MPKEHETDKLNMTLKIIGSTTLVLISAFFSWWILGHYIKPEVAEAPKSDAATSAMQVDIASLKMTLYVPADEQWQTNARLVVSDNGNNSSAIFWTRTDYELAKGIAKGDYIYYVYPTWNSDSFMPPESCGAPLYEKSMLKSPLPCQKYDGVDDITAYVREGHAMPGAVENASVDRYMTIYAKRDDNTIIAITSADTTYEDLYKRLKAMKPIASGELPASAITRVGADNTNGQ